MNLAEVKKTFALLCIFTSCRCPENINAMTEIQEIEGQFEKFLSVTKEHYASKGNKMTWNEFWLRNPGVVPNYADFKHFGIISTMDGRQMEFFYTSKSGCNMRCEYKFDLGWNCHLLPQ